MSKSGLTAFLIKELKEVLPPTIFVAVGFNLLVLTTDLILADYIRSFASFLVATMTALVVGKSVLVANALPTLRRFDTAPVIQTVLFKTVILSEHKEVKLSRGLRTTVWKRIRDRNEGLDLVVIVLCLLDVFRTQIDQMSGPQIAQENGE